MDIWMNVVRYETLAKCKEKNVVPFAVCISKSDVRNKEIDKYIDKYYGIVIDKRGYSCCICNVILADKCRDGDYKNIRMQDKTMKKIKEFKPVKNKQLEGKVIVDIVFSSKEKINSIELVETAINDIERGKILVNEE
jgi:hypothetical protein